jgi:putative ABC transport system permease protein
MALIVSIPLSYILIDKWLQNFANQTQMSWWVFALAGLVALGIASITVSWQSIKVASRNPVEALRYE